MRPSGLHDRGARLTALTPRPVLRSLAFSVVTVIAACAPRALATARDAPAPGATRHGCSYRASPTGDSLVVVVSYPMRPSDAAIGSAADTSRSWAAFADSVVSPGCGTDSHPVRIREVDARAARDAVDDGADVVLTSDPSTIAYARARPDMETEPLAWSRTYVLVVTRPDTSIPNTDSMTVFRASLARDAIREDARPAAVPSGMIADSCGLPVIPVREASAVRADRMVYRYGDTVARELAERLVALAESRSAILATAVPALAAHAVRRAVSLGAADFARSIESGSDAAYVLPIGTGAGDPCAAPRALVSFAPWIHAAAPSGPVIVPLVDTRATAIVHRIVVPDSSAPPTSPAPPRSTP